MNLIKKTVALVAVIAMMAGMVPAVQAATIMDGDLVKAADSSAIYYISGSEKRVIPHVNVYSSWGYTEDFSTVKTISAADLASYTDGNPVPFRDGSLFRGTASSLHGKDASAVFVVSEGKLRAIQSAEIYQGLYSDASWSKVTWVPDDLLSKFEYPLGDIVDSSAAHPEGSLVRYEGTDTIYVIEGGNKRMVSSAAFEANRYEAADVIDIAATEVYADGENVTGAESGLLTPGTWTTEEEEEVVTGGLTVALASDTPAGTTLIADSTSGDGAQAMVPFTKVNFTAGSEADVKVTEVKFTRGGISDDTLLSSLSLWDGDTKVADYNSFIDKVVTFTKSAGLFTVPAGTTKGITLKADIANGTGSKTITFSIASAADVTTDGATVTGSAAGKSMATTTVGDLGKLTVATSNQLSTVNPGDTGKEVWSFTVNPDSQDINIEKVKFTMVGTADSDDLANFKLYEGSTQLGETAAAMDEDKTVTFSGLNYEMDKSATTKTLSLKADIVSGTSRTFQFSIENMYDVVVEDLNYGAYIKPNQADTWTIIQAASSTTINSGTLTITRSSDSAVGNVADNATDITLAKFDFKANGENIKVISLPVAVDLSTATTINNVKLLVDGSQVGTTNTSMDDNTAETFTLSNTFIVPAGETKVLSIVGDIEGTSMAGGATIIAKINAGSSNARGLSSSSSISTTAGTGNTLTVATGTISVAKNISLAEYTSTYPTGVAGVTDVKIASFVVTAGSAEGSEISQMVIRDDDASVFLGDYYQNLKVMIGDEQIGDIQGNLTASAATSYTFTPANAIELAAAEAKVVDVYADIKSGVSLTTANVLAKMNSISYTTSLTAESTSWTTGVSGQDNYIATSGNLYVSKDSSSVAAKQMVMGATGETMATFKLEQQNKAEGINISAITITDTTSAAAAAPEIMNIRIYDGSTLLGTVPTLSGATTDWYATFNLAANLEVPKAGTKYLTVKADVTPYQGNSTSANTHTFEIDAAADVTARGASSNTSVTILDSSGGAFGAGDADGNTHYVYRTKPTFAVNSVVPGGATVPNAAQPVLALDVSADASYDVILQAVKFKITGTSADVAASKTYTLYDWNDTNIGSVSTTSSSGIWADFTTSDLTATTVPKGETKTFTLYGDTSGSLEDKSLQVLINASTDVTWSDGIAAETDSALNKSIPLYGPTFTY